MVTLTKDPCRLQKCKAITISNSKGIRKNVKAETAIPQLDVSSGTRI